MVISYSFLSLFILTFHYLFELTNFKRHFTNATVNPEQKALAFLSILKRT
jgi:hypothetical protein